MTYVVGLTGGIGSGKTTVANFFSKLNVPIIDADELAREVVAKESPLLAQLVAHFGTVILRSDGQLDRSALRRMVFADATQRKWLEALLHPAIDDAILRKISELNYPYCIVVIPLLAEYYSRYQKLLSHVIVVDTPIEKQRLQAVNRDQDPAMVDQIIQSQATAKERLKIANTVLENIGNLEDLEKKVTSLHQIFLAQSTSQK